MGPGSAIVASLAVALAVAPGAWAHGVVVRDGDALLYSANDPGVGAVVEMTSPEPGVVQIVDRTSPGGFAWGPCLPITPRKARCELRGIERIVIEVFDGDDSITVKAATRVQVRAGTGDDRVVGGYGDDTLSGESGADVLIGGEGADTVAGGDGDDSLRLRDGVADPLSCGGGADTVSADESDRLDELATVECENVTAAAPAVDSQPPGIDLELSRRASLRRSRVLPVDASISEPGEITLGGRILIDGDAVGGLREDSAQPDAPGQTWTLRPRLSRALFRKAKRALSNGDRVVLALLSTAVDEAGNRDTEHARIRLRPG